MLMCGWDNAGSKGCRKAFRWGHWRGKSTQWPIFRTFGLLLRRDIHLELRPSDWTLYFPVHLPPGQTTTPQKFFFFFCLHRYAIWVVSACSEILNSSSRTADRTHLQDFCSMHDEVHKIWRPSSTRWRTPLLADVRRGLSHYGWDARLNYHDEITWNDHNNIKMFSTANARLSSRLDT